MDQENLNLLFTFPGSYSSAETFDLKKKKKKKLSNPASNNKLGQEIQGNAQSILP